MRTRELKAARARLGLSQTELARELGISRGAVARYEVGTLKIPKVIELAVAYLETRPAGTRKSA